jgi:hypothetical protein
MARKSKRKPRAINWTAILWVAVCFNILLGLGFSPVTSIRRLRILGAQPHDQQRFSDLAQSLRGVPAFVVSKPKFEGAILASRDVYDAKLSRNLFGSSILRVQYRKPVAVLGGAPHVYMDEQGVIFASPEEYNGLRELDLDPEYMQPGVALTLPWPSQIVADLCIKLDTFDQLKGDAVHLDTTGRLLISRENSCTVDLGGTEQLEIKLAKLRRLLDDDPQLLGRLQSLSLTDPTHPALIVRKGNNK